MPIITIEDVKEALPVVAGIFAAVWLFGKVVEKNIDVDQNWQDYIDDLKKRR